MNEQESAESDKLMIVESGRPARRGRSAAAAAPMIFERQIIGRHVIYKGSDNTRLRSMAEARRYFKNKGHFFVQSQFDFTPPDSASPTTSPKKRSSPSPSSSAATNSPVKKGRGRQKASAGATAVSTKPSPPKLATTRRRELADDLKTIRDALQQVGHEAEAEPTSTDTDQPRRRPGRPKKQQTPVKPTASATSYEQGHMMDTHSTMKLENETEPVDNGPPESTTPVAGKSDQDSPDEANKSRPSRQRRPNQRYTDLISEQEASPRKKPRKEETVATKPSVEPKPVPQSPKAPIGNTTVKTSKILPVFQFGVPRYQKVNVGMAQPRMSIEPKKGNASPKRNLVQKSKNTSPQKSGIHAQTVETPVVDEMIVDQDQTVNPVGADDYDTPSEFVEIQERAITPQEDLLPPVLPAAPPASMSGSLFAMQLGASAGSASEQATSTTSSSAGAEYKRVNSGSGTAVPMFDPDEIRHATSAVQETANIPVKRGRKPAGSLAKITKEQGRLSFDESIGRNYSISPSPMGALRGGPQGVRSAGRTSSISQLESPPLLEAHRPGGVVQPSLKGIAKLQVRDPKTMTIGRYGAKSAGAMMRAEPPELDSYRNGGEKRYKPKSNDQRHRQADPAESAFFCHLPPEVVSDHCYGRQPQVATPAEDPHKGKHYMSKTLAPIPGRRDPYSTGQSSRSQYGRQLQTPSPPSAYSSSRRNYGASTSNYESTSANTTDFRGSSTIIGGQHHIGMMNDKLPANILEEDDGESGEDSVTSISIN